ncbi:UNVERIFIED_ORG: alpha-galactosidase/6-phospho-beta-glucosidase family protein, partial [Rhizobium etli]
MLTRLGYFVTESSEHFAEYTPYFIKEGREDLIEKFGIPLDEYPKRCIEQIERWKGQAEAYRTADKIEVQPSKEYASSIINSVWTVSVRRTHFRVSRDGIYRPRFISSAMMRSIISG